MNLTRGLLTATIACFALAAAASPARAIKKIFVRIDNRSGHSIHVEVAGAQLSSVKRDTWRMGELPTYTLNDGQAVESEASAWGNSSWSSWVRAYRNPSQADNLNSGCSMVFSNPFLGYPSVYVGLDNEPIQRSGNQPEYQVGAPVSRFNFAVNESHTFEYEAKGCKVRVVRNEDGPDHKRFDVTFAMVRGPR